MGVVTKSSTIIANRDAVPATKNFDFLEGGMPRESVCTLTIATGDTSGSKYLAFPIPSGARLTALTVWSDDMGTATTIDIGLYDTTANGGAVVSQTLLCSNLDVHSGALAGVNEMFQIQSVTAIEKRLWELALATSDPYKDYDVVIYLHTTADVGGAISLKCAYVI